MKSVGSTIVSEAQITVTNLKRAEMTNRQILLSQTDPQMTAYNVERNSKKTLVQTLEEIYNNSASDPQSRKLFIRNIAEGVPDSVIESLIIEAGEINYWRRSKNEKSECVSFGTGEFKTIEGVLKAIRLLQKFSIFNKKIEISYSEKTKNLIGEFIEFKKAEIASRYHDQKLTDEEIEDRLTETLCHNDEMVTKKLKLIIEKFEMHKEKIQKSSVHDKTTMMAATEEKMGLFKQKYDLMNEKELNEAYSRDYEEWLKKEAHFQKEHQAQIEQSTNLHKKKISLIEDEIKVKESDLYPRNEKEEFFWKRNKFARQKILQADADDKARKINISMESMAAGKRTKEQFDESHKRSNNDQDGKYLEKKKKVKSDVIVLQSTTNENREHGDKNHSERKTPGREYDDHKIQMDLSIPSHGHSRFKSSTDASHVNKLNAINDQLVESDDDHLILEKKKTMTNSTIKKLEKTVELNKTLEHNLEEALIK